MAQQDKKVFSMICRKAGIAYLMQNKVVCSVPKKEKLCAKWHPVTINIPLFFSSFMKLSTQLYMYLNFLIYILKSLLSNHGSKMVLSASVKIELFKF